jgi:hypothetical protein
MSLVPFKTICVKKSQCFKAPWYLIQCSLMCLGWNEAPNEDQTTPNFKTPYTLQELNMANLKQFENKITKRGLDDKTWLIGNDHIPNF